MSTKVYKVELMVIDHDDVGPAGVVSVIENTRYPNRCINPTVVSMETREVEWSDDHPLNKLSTQQQAYEKLFK